MATWTVIPDANLVLDKPVRSVDALALRDNPVAIAERAAGAPRVQVPQRQVFTASGTFTIPSGVTAFTAYGIAGGGAVFDSGGSGGALTGATASSVTYNGVTVSATGGATSDSDADDGGVPTNSDFPGGKGQRAFVGPRTSPRIGGAAGAGTPYGGSGSAQNYGSGGFGLSSDSNAGRGGSGGGAFVKRFTVVPGVTSASITVGQGASYPNLPQYSGAPGIVVIEY